jgi:hypothetical protein
MTEQASVPPRPSQEPLGEELSCVGLSAAALSCTVPSSLTPDGARLAREWDPCSLYARRDRRWYLKVRTNPRPEGAAVSHSESGAAVR